MRGGRNLQTLADRFKARFPEGGWQAKTRDRATPGAARFVERMGQFLMLVALSALVIAGIGVGNGVASWLDGKRESIATLKVLGASSRTIFQTYLIQVGVVAAFAIVAGLVMGALAPWSVAMLAGNLLPVAPRLDLYPIPLALGAIW